jgi:hypothetical protein
MHLGTRLLIAALLLLPAACNQGSPVGAAAPDAGGLGSATGPGATNMVPPNVLNIPQVPVPPGATISLEDTVIVGADETWTGQVVMQAPFRVVQVTGFFRAEMPKFGWVETAIVRSRRVAISFTRDDRVAIVRIAPKGGGFLPGNEGTSEIDVIVSPAYAPDPGPGGPKPRANPTVRRPPS